MRLRDWAEANEIDYRTALRWFHDGKVDGAERVGKLILVKPVRPEAARRLVGYARVSSADQAADLKRQADRLRVAGAVDVISETGSGLNGSRPKLRKLLAGNDDIVVEHRERLARFGVEYIEAALSATGRRLVILEPKEMEDDLVRDMIDVLTSFCARLYGRRSARTRAERAVECAATPPFES